uniref:M56 family metallopeptidase n=1 Tax=Longirhabdus pacifica TaxID=2305227 RepID=UPI001008A811
FLLKRYAAKWTYYAWLIIIIGLIIPFRPEINMSLIEVNLPFASTENEAQMVAPGDSSFQSMEFEQARNGEEQQSFFYSGEAMEQGAIDASSVDADVARYTDVGSANAVAERTNVNGEVPFYTTALQDNGAGEATTDHSVLTSNTEEQTTLITSIVGWTAIVFAIWLTGALSYLIYQLHTYRSFSRTVRRWSVLIDDVAITHVYRQLQKDMGIKTNISLKYSSIIDTPMLIGYLKPTIVLPRTSYQLNELRFVLTHELVHYKRKDMWVKALTMVATAIHWFNPLLYVMSKAISSQCEISCDEAVVKRIDQNGRREYGEMILKTARDQHRKIQTTLTTNFYGGKKEMKKRLVSIMNIEKKKAGIVIASGVLVMTSLTGGIFAVADVTQPAILGQQNETILDNVNIAANEQTQSIDPIILINGYKLETEHAPYEDNDEENEEYLEYYEDLYMVYVPFFDVLTAIGGTLQTVDEQTFNYTYNGQTAEIKIIDEEVTMTGIDTVLTQYPDSYKGSEEHLQFLAKPYRLASQIKEDILYVSADYLNRYFHVNRYRDEQNSLVMIATEETSSLVQAVDEPKPDLKRIQQLIASGENVNARNHDGEFVLQTAIMKENVELVKTLLNADADVNATIFKKGSTLLDAASKVGNKEIISMIMNANPVIQETDSLFYDALQAVLNQNKSSLQEVQRKGFNINATNQVGETLLTVVSNWDKEAVDMVIELGANVDTLNAQGMTPLMKAAHKGKTEVVSYLLQKGANKDMQQAAPDTGRSALMFAVTEGHKDTVQALLDAGVNIDLQVHGHTPLHMALLYHWGTSLREELALSLVKAGADVSIQDDLGQTALHLSPSVKLARAIIESDKNINLDIKDLEGYSALDLAMMNGNKEMKQFLLSKGATESDVSFGSEALKRAVRSGDLEKVKQLVNDGANVKEQSAESDGFTLLMEAIMSNNIDLTKYLIDQGVDVSSL